MTRESARDPARLAELKSLVTARLDQTVVALDFDGTLAPIVPRPEDARALPEANEVLAMLADRVAQVAIVTGRPAGEAVRFGHLDDIPDLIVYGHYGLELWTLSEGLSTPNEVSGIAEARARVRALVAEQPGVTVEDKGHSVAVHTRLAPDPVGALEGLRAVVSEIAGDTGLQVTPGRFVLELRPVGADKGAALRKLVADNDATAVVYAGDDLGDIPAVDAVRDLESQGIVGMVVCSDSAEVAAEFRNRADVIVPGPSGVMSFLRELGQATS